jgi:hypothetical protein
MEKIATTKKQKPKASKKKQFERFQQTARELGIDDKKSAETFERSFNKIIPPKRGAT